MQGEYIVVDGWPIQFLPPGTSLVEEALKESGERDEDGTSARVFTAEHLAAIALQTGRAKGKARLLEFVEDIRMSLQEIPSGHLHSFPGFLKVAECDRWVALVEQHLANHLTTVNFNMGVYKLRYRTIFGRRLANYAPELMATEEKVKIIARQVYQEEIELLKDIDLGVVLNVMLKGDSLDWHYDKNLLTCILYLGPTIQNRIEVCPGYRLKIRNNHRAIRKVIQKSLDLCLMPSLCRRLFATQYELTLERGTLLVFDDTCMHRVVRLEPERKRCTLSFFYDSPGKEYPVSRVVDFFAHRIYKSIK